MSFSGIRVRDEVVSEFNTMKLRHSFRYIQMKISDDEKWIEIEKVSPTDATTYAEFVEQLPRKDCRYVIYDFPYETESSGQQEKLVFFLWCPEEAKVKSKMIYAASTSAIGSSLVGIGPKIQLSGPADLNEKEITEKVKSNKR